MTPRKQIASKPSRTFPTADLAIGALEARLGPVSAKWAYQDAEGTVVGWVLRWDHGNGRKTISPVSKHGDEWAFKGMPAPRPLLGLPALLALPKGTRVYVVEGEKCVDACRRLGLAATTSAHGGNSADRSDWAALAGMEVVVLPDRNDAGEVYARKVTQRLHGVADSVRTVRLWEACPDIPAGGDIVDFVQRRSGTEEEIRDEVHNMADSALMNESKPDPATRYRSFPLHVLPQAMQKFVVSGAACCQCDPAFIALPLLSSVALAIGSSRCVELNSTWRESCIVWTCTVGKSGSGKSHSMTYALQFVRDRQDRARIEHRKANVEYEKAKKTYARALKQWNTDGVGEPPQEPEAPVLRRLTTDDTTVEGLGYLHAINPRGLMVASDELSGFFRSFNAYRQGRGRDVSNWLLLGSGQGLEVDRRNAPPICLPSTFISLTGGVQPGVLRDLLTTEFWESGLVARFLVVEPPICPRAWQKISPDADAVAEMGRIFNRLFDLTPEETDVGPRPEAVRLSPSAEAVFGKFYNEYNRLGYESDGAVGAAYAKLIGYAARFALLLHLVRAFEDNGLGLDPWVVDECSMANAIELVRWFRDEMLRVYGNLSGSDTDWDDRQLLDWIERRGVPVTPADVASGVRMYRRDAAGAEAALERLAAQGSGHWSDWSSTGRPTRRFIAESLRAVMESIENRRETGLSMTRVPSTVGSEVAE